MNLDRLLIIGSTGLVGSKVASMAQSYGFDPYCTANTRQSNFARSSRLDITDLEATLRLVEETKPRAIVNTAALTNVDYCETHREEADRVNVHGVRNLSEAAQQNGSRLIHISTDSVFDGSSGNYSESDVPNPLNYYSETKRRSEEIVLRMPNFAIARSSVIYGWVPTYGLGVPAASAKALNFGLFVLDKLSRSETVNAVRDQYTCPTFANNLSDALLRLARSTLTGIFHTVGRSCVSRYEFALKICEVFGFPSSLVHPILSSELHQIAVRPKNTCLTVERAERALNMRFLTVQEGLSQMRSSREISKGSLES